MGRWHVVLQQFFDCSTSIVFGMRTQQREVSIFKWLIVVIEVKFPRFLSPPTRS